MPEIKFAVAGLVAVLIAGAIRSDPGSAGMQLVLTLSWGLLAFGAFAVVAAGVATGIRLSRR
ncbi:MAG: hypothetical protein HOQ45_02960 [Nocardioidaceae bacterium]|nr:hypothetical protein [Nocardioidaceae bacterium]